MITDSESKWLDYFKCTACTLTAWIISTLNFLWENVFIFINHRRSTESKKIDIIYRFIWWCLIARFISWFYWTRLSKSLEWARGYTSALVSALIDHWCNTTVVCDMIQTFNRINNHSKYFHYHISCLRKKCKGDVVKFCVLNIEQMN